MSLELRKVSHSYGALEALSAVDLKVSDGQVTVLLGPSGCGKTTILNIVSGSVTPTSGSVSGREHARLSYLYQEPRLLPWRSVEDNLRFVLEGTLPPNSIDETIDHVLQTVELQDFRRYYPHELSGGMRQRVALARAFAYPGDLLLMDEPFRALDLRIKAALARYFARSWAAEPITTIYVTHDIQEALLIGDVIHVLRERPASVESIIGIDIKREDRSLADGKLIEVERELYRLLG